jgi:hypothetical protein
MVRVASAQTVTNNVALNEGNLGVFGYSKVQLSLQPVSKIDPASIGELALGEKVKELLGTYSTFESFLRGPVRAGALSVPRPVIPLTAKERRVYDVLAQKRMYPEVKVLSEIIEMFREEVKSQDYLLSLKERGSAQKECFAQGDYSYECTLKVGLEDKVTHLITTVIFKGSQDHQGLDSIKDGIMSLILKKVSPTVASKEAFLSDSAHHWLSRRTLGEYLVSCVTLPKSFQTYELIGSSRCRESIGNLIEEEGLEPEAKRDVFSTLFNPYGVFKLMLASLSETVLDKGIFCFSDNDQTCRRRKVRKRLEEWPYLKELTERQRETLIRSISLYWLE